MNEASITPESPVHSGFDWNAADAYLFDIDGTLLLTRDLIHYNALNLAMHEVYGVATTIDGIAYHGKTDLGILRAALARSGVSDQAFEARLPSALDVICREVERNQHAFDIEICPGIRELLSHLRDQGKLLAVASGNLESVGWQKIAAAGLRDFFRFGCFSDRTELRSDIFIAAAAEARKRAHDKASVCFLGDTPEDVRAARSAGANIIAVCTGIFKRHQLSPLNPDLCIESCASLLAA